MRGGEKKWEAWILRFLLVVVRVLAVEADERRRNHRHQ